MLILAVLALGQAQYDPEIEAVLRRQDEARRQAQVERAQDEPALAKVMPSPQAKRLTVCLAKADVRASAGIAEAEDWAGEGGGPYAAHCKGYALGRAGRWAEAASAFEAGAALRGIDVRDEARLWAQAGNAALIAGNAERASQDLDRALDKPLPDTLSTGEIHLDRARARVATGNLEGAREDLDRAVQLAPADPLAWLLSATLARRMDDLPLARAHIEQASKLARNDANVALEQGIIYALSGDRDPAARAAFERAQAAAKDSDIAKKAQAYLAQLPAASKRMGPATAK